MLPQTMYIALLVDICSISFFYLFRRGSSCRKLWRFYPAIPVHCSVHFGHGVCHRYVGWREALCPENDKREVLAEAIQ